MRRLHIVVFFLELPDHEVSFFLDEGLFTVAHGCFLPLFDIRVGFFVASYFHYGVR